MIAALAIVVALAALVLLLALQEIEPGAYDPEEYVDEWRRKRGRR